MTADVSTRPGDAASNYGMVLGVVAFTLFSLHDAFIKAVVTELPLLQILATRALMIVVVCLIIGRRKLWRESAVAIRKPIIWVRSLLTLVAWVLYFGSGPYLQLAEMTTLYYVAPVITMVLAIIFLGERLTATRTIAALIGFAGVVLAVNPFGMQFSLPALACLTAAACWAVAMILMRKISKSEGTLVQVFIMSAFYVVILGVVMVALQQWEMFSWQEFAYIGGAAAVGGVAQGLIVEAARRVPAGVLGTIEYSGLIWAFVLGYVFWLEMPTASVYLGAGFVMLAGLIMAWGEQRERRRIH